MRINKTISDVQHQKGFAEAIRQARLSGPESFQSWFNKSGDINQSMIRGYWDLTIHILTPKVCQYIKNPEEKIALEIGYGGGRIINAACSYFKEVIGIDIHGEQETVEAFLKTQGKNNFRLIRTGGRSIDIDSESVDFVYSFIVLQHLYSFDVFVNYVKESYRCLKPEGVAQLYFGRYSRLDILSRLLYFAQGYKEIPDAPINHTSLVISVNKAKKICREVGFRILEIGTSYKDVPDGYPAIKGGQNYITLLK